MEATKQITFNTKLTNYIKLKEISSKLNVTITSIINNSIENYIRNYNNKKRKEEIINQLTLF